MLALFFPHGCERLGRLSTVEGPKGDFVLCLALRRFLGDKVGNWTYAGMLALAFSD